LPQYGDRYRYCYVDAVRPRLHRNLL
jgi:hypothetical protein